jgi:hypothetical protein
MKIAIVALLFSASAYAQDVLPPVHQLPSQHSIVELAVSTPKVNLVYLVPSDKAVKQNYVSAMNTAIASLIQWYSSQTANHKTFQASTPAVIVVPLPHDSSYYANNPRPAIFTQFWDNVLGDAFPLTGGRFSDPQNVWAYYIDADPISTNAADAAPPASCSSAPTISAASRAKRTNSPTHAIRATSRFRTPSTAGSAVWVTSWGTPSAFRTRRAAMRARRHATRRR